MNVDLTLISLHVETKLKEKRVLGRGRLELGQGFQVWAPAMGTMGGVAIVMTKFFQGQVLDYFLDTQGRWAWVWVETEGERLLVSTVYAPQETTQKKWFWRDVPTNVPDTRNSMMMGDFNTVVQPGLDSPQAGPPRLDAEALRLMMAEMAMEDAFRETWLKEKGFTWIGAGLGRRSRLDMAWVQRDLLHKLLRVVALPVAMSDHKLLLTEFLLPPLVETWAQPPTVPHWMFRDPLHIRLAKQHWEYWAGLRTKGVSATRHFQQGLLELRRVMLARAKVTRQAHLRTGEKYISEMEELGTEPREGEEEEWWVVGQVIGPLLQEICDGFFRDRKGFPQGFGEANIILRHKKGDPMEIRNWRPVSLLSAPYKLYAKVLANRLTEVLPDLVHPTQTGFVPTRQILTNVIMVREVLRRAEESDPPLAVLLLDFEKAYDRVRWGFLLRGMEKRGIGPRFRLAVQDLLGSATATVQINGFRSQPMRVTRSVRQGCPLSPALYILYVEHLHDILRGDGRIRGLCLPDSRELKSNSFADDTAAFVECSETAVRAVREQVHNFEIHAGAKVNWRKSMVMLHEEKGADMRMCRDRRTPGTWGSCFRRR
ncbi:hypothetical protein CBR_g50141 [Chara braunii]|uniref:Reverse transcriptase domain-containing protein n=1 Tax=Chara braunii TaxID=69332 RepID=A0A388M631_CHABU|nr:hypothetical protein CBR_g50141 [Chara braunii]|eukprot:GBG90048.1 hypothetical protein CBR_g50141 [Chara braunii]